MKLRFSSPLCFVIICMVLIAGVTGYRFVAPKTISLSFIDESGPVNGFVLIFPYNDDMSLPDPVPKKKDNVVYLTTAQIYEKLSPDGQFVWEKANPGKYWVSVNHALFELSIPVTFKSNLEYSFETIPQYHTVNITVKNDDGSPIKNAFWEYQFGGKNSLSSTLSNVGTRTNDKGELIWEGVPPGCHNVWIGGQEFQIKVFPDSPENMFVKLTLQ